MPKNSEEGRRMMAEWNGWMEQIGSHLVDRGAGFGNSRFLSAPDREEKAGDPLSGYSLVEAVNIEAALDMARKNSIFSVGGTIEVAECIQM